MSLVKFRNETSSTSENVFSKLFTSLGLATLYGIAGSLFFVNRRPNRPGKKLDIEVRYNTPEDADTTFLVQNLVKIISMVLTPLEPRVTQEGAKLIFVYGDDSWEIRVRNGSERLKESVRKLLEAREW